MRSLLCNRPTVGAMSCAQIGGGIYHHSTFDTFFPLCPHHAGRSAFPRSDRVYGEVGEAGLW
jgi:hypothetical protein